MTTIAPYGSWRSPLSAQQAPVGERELTWPKAMQDSVFWIERQPDKDRTVLMCQGVGGEPREVLPEAFQPGSKVHESYSGSPYTVHDGSVYFVNKTDQRLCRMAVEGGEVTVLTPDTQLRHVDPVVDAVHHRVLCVAQDHSGDGEPVNTVVAISLDGGPSETLVSGADFYSGVRPSPDGKSVCWISWCHPNMPWNGTELWVADLDSAGALGEPRLVAGGPAESIATPYWSADGRLWFISDRSGWWNLYRSQPGDPSTFEAFAPIEADCARPQWAIGLQSYAVLSDAAVLVVLRRGGRIELAHLTPQNCQVLGTPYIDFGDICWGGTTATVVAGESARTPSLVDVDLATLQVSPRYHDASNDLDPADVSVAEQISFPTADGETSHAYFYPPASAEFVGPQGELPPLLVTVHGGPTSAAKPSLNRIIQFWTSRGYAVVDLNHRGSTGYGRAYWEKLYGNWGVVDVEDSRAVAEYLVAQGWVDPQRLAIRGGSAGGFTTLAALAFDDVFHAGVSYYGVADMELMEQETHKFESRYTGRLVRGDNGPQELMDLRSPLYSAEKITAPVLFLQGADDPVVPPNQSDLMFEKLVEAGIPTAYILFEGESHGFRKVSTIQRSLEAELTFFSRIFGVERADLEPLEIRHDELLATAATE